MIPWDRARVALLLRRRPSRDGGTRESRRSVEVSPGAAHRDLTVNLRNRNSPPTLGAEHHPHPTPRRPPPRPGSWPPPGLSGALCRKRDFSPPQRCDVCRTSRPVRCRPPTPNPLKGDRKTAKLASHCPTARQVRLLPSVLTPTDHPEDACPNRCCPTAPPSRLYDRRRGPDDLDTAGGRTTISDARLSLSRSAAWLFRRRAAAHISQPRIWRTRRSPAASARSDPAPAWRCHGLATRLLELEKARLGMGVRPLRLPPVRTCELGSWSLEPTTQRVGVGAGALAIIISVAPDRAEAGRPDCSHLRGNGRCRPKAGLPRRGI
jgi:hypothetical protein